MKITNFAVLLIFLNFIAACGKQTASDTSAIENKLGIKAEETIVTTLEKESDPNKRMALLINNADELSPNTLDQLLESHTNKKISIFEFRSLFWINSSKELLLFNKEKISLDAELTKLDKLLLDSIVSNNVQFTLLLNEIKEDNEESLPTQFQLATIKELVRVYERDFDQINSLDFEQNLGHQLDYKGSANKKELIGKIKNQIELTYFKRLLASNRLISKKNNDNSLGRSIETKFNLTYGISTGRCDPTSGSVSFETLTQGFGRNCHYDGGGTDTNVGLDVNSTSNNFGDFKRIDLVVRTFERGGYQQSRHENETAILNYQIAGKIVIPQCSNPVYCKQIIRLTLADTMSFYSDASDTKEGVSLTINGNPVKNENGNFVDIDLSKQDAIVLLNFSLSKTHVGACCNNGPLQQRIGLLIDSSENVMVMGPLPGISERSKRNFLFPFDAGNMFFLYGQSNEEYWQDLMNNTKSSNEYRKAFYSKLNMFKYNLNEAVTANRNPIEVTSINENIQKLSDKTGRGLILPIVNSKIDAFQKAQSLNMQSKINSIVKLLLANILNNQISNIEMNERLLSKTNELNNTGKDIVNTFVENANSASKDLGELLKDLSRLQTDLELSIMNINLELQVLNLEKAQFEDINEKGTDTFINTPSLL